MRRVHKFSLHEKLYTKAQRIAPLHNITCHSVHLMTARIMDAFKKSLKYEGYFAPLCAY